MDLRRVTFPTGGITVTEHGPKRLEIFTDDWLMSVQSIDSVAADNMLSAHRSSYERSRGTREDLLAGSGSHVIRRFRIAARGPNHAARADYLISLGGAWFFAVAGSRSPLDHIDVRPVDNLLLALRLGDKPRLEAQVLPAWQRYQRDRRPDSPIAKFVLAMTPAPVVIGASPKLLRRAAPLTKADFSRGGRKLAPDQIEFYSRGDPSAIRVDLWLNSAPQAEVRESVFDATLSVGDTPLCVWSLDEPFNVSVPPGEYDVKITVQNRGKHSDRHLTDDERFARDDLERYDVDLLARRGSSSERASGR